GHVQDGTTAPPPAGLSFVQTSSGFGVDTQRNARFLYATFTVNNNTGGTLNNLCFVAVDAPGNLGGTAIRGVSGFASSGLTSAQFARSSKPAHRMTASGSTSVIDTNNANLHLSSPAESAAGGCGGASVMIGTVAGTNLEYGFVANELSIADGGTGTFTVTYRLAANNTDDTGIVVSLRAVKDGASRVSQSAQETVAQVNARATSRGVPEIAYSGPGSATAVPPAGVTPIRLADPKISTGAAAATLYGP
ncbi:MAG: hypothetical protein ACRDAM_09555, partial [Casimicrobium sp.]